MTRLVDERAAKARSTAIAKLDARVRRTAGISIAYRLGVVRQHRFINPYAPLDTLGHQLQRAAAENA